MRNINNSDNRINVDSRNYSTIARFRQEDDATLVVNLYKNGEEFDVSNQTITLRALRLDGQSVNQTDNITKNKNIVTINLRRNVLEVVGRTSIQLNISDASGQFTTAEFFIEVEKNNLGSDALKGSDNIQALQQILIDFKAEKSSLIKNITDDYNSLKKIIISQNQAADLQNQINLNKQQSVENTTRIEQLEDLTPVWQEHEGIENVTVNDSFDGTTKDLVVKGRTLKNLIPYKTVELNSTIRSKAFSFENIIQENILISVIVNITDKKAPKNGLRCGFKRAETGTWSYYDLTKGVGVQAKEFTLNYNVSDITFYIPNDEFTDTPDAKITFTNPTVCVGKNSVQFDSITSCGELEDNKIKIKSFGKNLFDPNYFNENAEAGNITRKLKYKLKPNTQYTCSSNIPKADGKPATVYFNGGSSDTNGVFLNTPKTFTSNSLGEIDLFIRVNGESGFTIQDFINGDMWIQLEENSIVTNYEQYRSKLIEIQLPFEKGLKSTLDNSVYDEINGNTGEIIQRVSDEYTALAKPIIHKINDIQLNTFDTTTHITQENNILSDISFKAKVSLSSQSKRLSEENKALKEENRELREDTNVILDSLISVFEPMMLPNENTGEEQRIILEKLYAIKNR